MPVLTGVKYKNLSFEAKNFQAFHFEVKMMIFASVIAGQTGQREPKISCSSGHWKMLEASAVVCRCCLFDNIDKLYCRLG